MILKPSLPYSTSCKVFVVVTQLVAVALFSSRQATASDLKNVSVPSYQLVQAAIAERIREEFSRQILDQEMKSALLEAAPPEDRLELKKLFAEYKRPTNIESLGIRLRLTDKYGQVAFEVAPPQLGETDFLINGRRWTPPASGSILQDLQRHLNPRPAKERKSDSQASNANSSRAQLGYVRFFLIVSRLNAQTTKSESSLLPLYYFIQANRGSGPIHLYDMIRNRSVDSPLRHGAHFKSTGELGFIKAIFKGITLSRYDVKCTRFGAEGFAEISGTKVEFVSHPDNALQVKSDGDNQWLIFEPDIVKTRDFTGHLKSLGSWIKSASMQEALRNFNSFQSPHRKAREIAIEMCEFARKLPRGTFDRNGCLNIPDLRSNAKDASIEAPSKDILAIKRWFERHEDDLLKAASAISESKLTRDRFARISACASPSCETLIPETEGLPYRIPPNRQESTVSDAISFKPKSSPASKGGASAKIEFNCPTKNSACQSVELRGGENLSGEDLRKAQDLVTAANESLKWKQSDPSVVGPVEMLRLLGPCCSDSNCRKLAFDKGINLIPQEGKGTAK